jgi:SAM-dependent methyltransferase
MRVHAGLPRQAPGSDAMTAAALMAMPYCDPEGDVYDLGCGPGRSTLPVASRLDTKVIAVDRIPEFLIELKEKAYKQGMSHLIETRLGDMTELDCLPESISVIWSEGAVYSVGFDKALKLWRPLLRTNGVIALTELSWLTDKPSPEAEAFWREAYPAKRSIASNIAAAERLGYACVRHIVLPESCWWDEYYNPLLANIEALAPEAKQDPDLAQAIASATAEIELFRRCHKDYGYVFYLLQKSPEL